MAVKTTLTVLSPIYKAADCVDELYRRVTDAARQVTSDYEIIFVEDCGGDGSWEKICRLAAKDTRLKAMQLSRNFGQHHAIWAGLAHAIGDWVVVLDCDMQESPEEIPRLFAKAQEGYDVVCARRVKRNDPLWKRYTSRVFGVVFNWLSGMSHDSQVSCMRIFSRAVADAYMCMGESTPSLAGHLGWLGFNIAFIDIQHQQRYAGRSSYSLKKLFNLAANMIVSYSNRPLCISISLGFLITLSSTVYAMFLALRKLWAGTIVDGWTSLMVSIWFLGGMVIGNLGIIGLYLGKTYDETKRRPLYVVSKRVNF